jgi:cell division protein FtsZ
LIFGAVIDQNMKEEIRITVIATGFERAGVPRSILETPKPRPERAQHAPARPAESAERGMHADHVERGAYVERGRTEQAPAPRQNADFQPRTFNTEDLDIPTFLRNRGR